MNLHDQWKAISARIHGLMQAGELHARFLAVRASDSYGRAKHLRSQIEGVLTSLESFKDAFGDSISSEAMASLDRTVSNISELIASAGQDQERVWAALVRLVAFETEFSFLLSDIQQSIRSRAELAFSHLKRLIVVDEDYRQKWKYAFENQREEASEKLGAVHLLHHGIWAFKVDAVAGGRTDLVFEDQITDLSDEQRHANGFVLTEWKKANTPDVAEQRFREARAQAQLYTEGPLASTELTGYRYAVVVSFRQVRVPKDVTEEKVVYRHTNIAVDPQNPSDLSRRAARSD